MKCLFYSQLIKTNLVSYAPFTLSRKILKTQFYFFRLGLLSTLMRHRNEPGVSKTFLKPENMKTPALRFSVDGNYFEKDTFSKPMKLR